MKTLLLIALFVAGCSDPCSDGQCEFDDGPAYQERAGILIWQGFYQEKADIPTIRWVSKGNCLTENGFGVRNPIDGKCSWGIFVSYENTIYIYEIPNNPRENWVTYVHELRHAHLHNTIDPGGDGTHSLPRWEDTIEEDDTVSVVSIPHQGADILHLAGVD